MIGIVGGTGDFGQGLAGRLRLRGQGDANGSRSQGESCNRSRQSSPALNNFSPPAAEAA